MDTNLHEWLNILIRWAHFLTGIMWIGSSLYFVWMDSSFEALPEPKKGIDGELWMVHGGNFYHVEKRKFGPGEMPKNLHWFKWEATFTWITGFMLLCVVYYLTNGAYLIDPRVKDLSPLQGTMIGIATLFSSWFVYDGLYRSKLAKSPLVNFLGLLFVGGLIYFLTHTFSGRGAFIHVGAVFGTIMVLNVWVHILPNQRAIIRASEAGEQPNYELGIKAKRRSMHNSYMTLPVLFIMISNHFASTFAHSLNWLVLILIILGSAMVRHTMITGKKWPLIISASSLLALYLLTQPPKAPASSGQNTPISFSQVQGIIQARCIQCHSTHATDDVFKVAPLGVFLESPNEIKQWALRIKERVVIQKTMPLANKTNMTEQEREILGRWIDQGAQVN